MDYESVEFVRPGVMETVRRTQEHIGECKLSIDIACKYGLSQYVEIYADYKYREHWTYRDIYDGGVIRILYLDEKGIIGSEVEFNESDYRSLEKLMKKISNDLVGYAERNAKYGASIIKEKKRLEEESYKNK